MERSDLDIPEETTIELGPGEQPAGTADEPPGTAGEPPRSLDPDRDQAERNAASGGWDGANEQIENDFEQEQLRRRQGLDDRHALGDAPSEEGERGARLDDDATPLT